MDWGLVEALILEKTREYRMPGISIAVVSGGETVYTRGHETVSNFRIAEDF